MNRECCCCWGMKKLKGCCCKSLWQKTRERFPRSANHQKWREGCLGLFRRWDLKHDAPRWCPHLDQDWSWWWINNVNASRNNQDYGFEKVHAWCGAYSLSQVAFPLELSANATTPYLWLHLFIWFLGKDIWLKRDINNNWWRY